jgi:hypothetical protein
VGQFAANVAYWSRNSLGDSFVLRDGRLLHALPAGPGKVASHKKTRKTFVLVEDFVGSRRIAPSASRESPTSLTVLSPKVGGAFTSASYESLDTPNAWPGIDLSVRNKSATLERVFTVHPGAQTKNIRVSLDGAASMSLAENGDLRVMTGVGELRYRKPVASQIDNQNRAEPISVKYRVLKDNHSFGFDLGNYDPANTLIIDPVLQGTYFGGQGNEAVMGMAADPSTGDLLISGLWESAAPPAVAGGFQELPQLLAVFIARFDRKLERVIQTTLLGGGSSSEVVHDMAIDPASGDVFVIGGTDSADFPGGGGGAEPTIATGRSDGFVSRFSGDLRNLKQTTFFGGSRGRALAQAIAINPNTSDVYVAGSGVGGAVVVRYNEALTQVLSRTALEGNTTYAVAWGVAINPTTNDVYVSGVTSSWSFPALAGGAISSSPHTQPLSRAFVSRFDATLTNVLQSTYVWNGQTEGYLAGETGKVPVTVDRSTGDVIVAAQTIGDVGPVSGGARPTFAGGNRDVLLARFSADLTQLRGATYFGGTNDEYATGVGVSLDGQHVYLGGYSYSSSLPGTTQTGAENVNNAYLTRVSPDLKTIEQTSYGLARGMDELAMTVHPTTGEVYIGGDAYDGVPQTRGGIQPNYVPAPPSFVAATTDAYVLRFDPALSAVPSTTPDSFTFVAQSGVALGSTVTSAPARVYGVTQPVPISIVGGQYSIDGVPYTGASGTIDRAQSVRVQQTAALTPGTQTQTVLTIGGVDGAFTSTTQTGTNATPAQFQLTAVSPVPRSVSLTSNAITVQGTNAPAPIGVTGGEYSIDGGSFTASSGMINTGQTVVVRQTSAAAFSTRTDTVLTIGGASATFSTVTDAMNTVPHAFAWASNLSAQANTDIGSEVAPISGINAPAPISATAGSYLVFDPNNPTSTNLVNNRDNVGAIVHTGGPGSTSTVTVTVGGVSGTFTALVPGPIPAGAVPDAFSFPSVTNAEPLVWVESAPVTLKNLTTSSPIYIAATNSNAAEWFDPNWGVFRPGTAAAMANFPPGQPLRVRVLTMDYATNSYVTISVGGVTATFNVSTRASATAPDPFQFADHLGVTPGSTVTSETISITGLDAPASVTATGCGVSINGQSPDVMQGTVNPGGTLSFTAVAPSAPGQTEVCTITVGGVSQSVKIATATPSAASKSGGGAIDVVSLCLLALVGLGRGFLQKGAKPIT